MGFFSHSLKNEYDLSLFKRESLTITINMYNLRNYETNSTKKHYEAFS